MIIEQKIILLENILQPKQSLLGDEYLGYRNHVYRMVHFCFLLQDCEEEQRQKILSAAAFHDLGIWLADTVDYLPPSIAAAQAYLQEQQLTAWSDEISLMINEHHKIRAYTNNIYPLVEVFRQGDLVDFSLGTVRFGLNNTQVQTVKAAFPNANFHRNLGKRAWRWFLRNPLNPAPMIKW